MKDLSFSCQCVPALSVIVPLAPGERSWWRLLADLTHLPAGSEILLASAAPPEGTPENGENLDGSRWRVSWVRTPRGRAAQMNAAARAARGSFLWFLHADTRLTPQAPTQLFAALRKAPRALHYFDLRYLPDGPRGMALNAWGATLRARLFGMPFGDQGFCLARDVFFAIGEYDVAAPYGEDHLLVWQAARARIKLAPVGAALYTSARKYREHGWARTTARHVFYTWKQALPQAAAALLGK